ncbi:MAG TPA: alpha-amylase family glycosyl hydrolase [Dermatophilaceae bacterium]|nr:alpha-amylase family glycosyl hydrolase [Dermatophilaceae bacterium]
MTTNQDDQRAAAETAHRPGMGALPYGEGTAFRVWAPHADAVCVMGDFNGWDEQSVALVSEGNGNWYADVPGAHVGQGYKYVVHNGDLKLYRIDPYARCVTNSVGHGVIYDHGQFDWEGDDFDLPGHHELVIYELHVGSFFTEEDGRPGTFELVGEKLEHLVKLGVNAVQIMPVMEFAGDFSWGYNPAHIFAVESGYGGPDALKVLVKEAHRRGLAVIVDVVYNHFGPSDLDLWQFDGWHENGKGGIYFYNDDRSSTPWGDTRPDYGREEVRRFIHDNAMMWFYDFHVDGLRFDMTPYIRSVHGSGVDLPEGWDLMRWINTSVRESYPRSITIAEDMHQDPRISQTIDGGAAFHAQWDGAFVHPVRQVVIARSDEERSIGALRDAIVTMYNGDAYHRVIYTESHDEVANGRARVPTEVNPDDPTGWHAQKRSTVGAALVLTSPGIPMLFQGQEFLQGEWFRDDVPLDWDLNEDFHGIVRLVRDLIRVRRNWRDTTRGLTGQHVDCYHLNEDENVLAFHRWSQGGPGDSVVVVVNLHHEPRVDYRIGMPAAGQWQLELNSDAKIYSDDFGDFLSTDTEAHGESQDGQPASALVSIAPYSVLVYSLRG